MRSRRIPARQAHEWGIAVECLPDAELESRIDAFVEEPRGFLPSAQRTLKGVLNAAQDAPLHVAIELEGQAYAGCAPRTTSGRGRIVLRQAQAGVQVDVSPGFPRATRRSRTGLRKSGLSRTDRTPPVDQDHCAEALVGAHTSEREPGKLVRADHDVEVLHRCSRCSLAEIVEAGEEEDPGVVPVDEELDPIRPVGRRRIEKAPVQGVVVSEGKHLHARFVAIPCVETVVHRFDGGALPSVSVCNGTMTSIPRAKCPTIGEKTGARSIPE